MYRCASFRCALTDRASIFLPISVFASRSIFFPSGRREQRKSRTKNAASINVSGDFYLALDEKVRELIAGAEARAEANNRRTLRPQDL